MANLRRFLPRRWVLVFLAALLCVLMIHPFVRQSLIGPTIDGIPWCVWEEAARRQVEEPQPQSWFAQMLEKLGLLRRDNPAVDWQSAKAIPVYLHLADDRDVKLRRFALEQLQGHLWRPTEFKTDATEALRRHLNDDDPECRLIAAHGVWIATKDVQSKNLLLAAAMDGSQPSLRWRAVNMLRNVNSPEPDLFEPLAKLTEDADVDVKREALLSMIHFGKRSVPILRKALHDPNRETRALAMWVAEHLGKDAVELTSILQTFENDPDPGLRKGVAHTLHKIDPMQFAKPAWVE